MPRKNKVVQKVKEPKTDLKNTEGACDELLAGLMKFGVHKDCSVGCKVGYGEVDGRAFIPDAVGVDTDGVPVDKRAYRHGCDCGIWALLAKYKDIKTPRRGTT